MFLTFCLEEDYTGDIPSRAGTLTCDFTHTASVGDASDYVIGITVRLNSGIETIGEREFIFSAIPNLDVEQQAYSPGSEHAHFDHTFLSGSDFAYQVEIEVSGTLLGGDPVYLPNSGGEITFSLQVDDLRIEF
jgi:hypothetical protein